MAKKLLALWFADIAGYSAQAANDEPGALQLVEILQTLARQTVAEYKGQVVKFMGDAVLAGFPSAELAVRAAVDLGKQYQEQSAVADRPHQLRIGVHLGDVT